MPFTGMIYPGKHTASKRPRTGIILPPSLPTTSTSTTPTADEYFAARSLIMISRGETYPNTSSKEPAVAPIPVTTSYVVPKKQTIKLKINNDGFVCNVCNKRFRSYQALGGHKSSHLFKNKVPVSTSGIQTGLHIREDLPEDSKKSVIKCASVRNQSGPLGTHKCSVCDKIYNTGQALGGHMRRHYNGNPGGSGKARTGRTTTTTTSTEGAAASIITMTQKPLEFDLNMPASPELLEDFGSSVDLEKKSQYYAIKEEVEESPLPLKLSLSLSMDFDLN